MLAVKEIVSHESLNMADVILTKSVSQNLKSLSHCERLNFVSGWQDSNLRPPAPKAGAITGLRYTPNSSKIESANIVFL